MNFRDIKSNTTFITVNRYNFILNFLPQEHQSLSKGKPILKLDYIEANLKYSWRCSHTHRVSKKNSYKCAGFENTITTAILQHFL